MPLSPNEQYMDLRFPTKGLDLSSGFGLQRPESTVLGTNVRTFDPSTDRARGGSRSGLVRFIGEQLPLE